MPARGTNSMSTDAPAAPPRKKRHVWRWVGLAVLLFLAWFCWQLLGPNPPIIVSRETTYITEPLGSDGLPDYKQYLLDKYREGVTPENNAAVLLLQAIGLDEDDEEKEHLAYLASELGLAQIPDEQQTLPTILCDANRQAIADWWNELHGAWGDSDAAITDRDDVIYKVADVAMESPWTSEQIPPLADWLHKHQQQIDLLVEASNRDRWYWPLDADGEESEGDKLLEYTGSFQLAREAGRALEVRAFWDIGEGQSDDAMRDLMAMRRLARLTASQGGVIDNLGFVPKLV